MTRKRAASMFIRTAISHRRAVALASNRLARGETCLFDRKSLPLQIFGFLLHMKLQLFATIILLARAM